MKHLLSSITLLLLSTLAFGQVPNSFSSGETISSSKINANFAYLADAIKNDNITAMLICAASGYSEQNPRNFYFANCFSTDNTEFTTNSNSLNIILSSYGTNYTYIRPINYIEFSELFNNKWILFNSFFTGAVKDNDIHTVQHTFDTKSPPTNSPSSSKQLS